jgi:hypothetical protein
MNIGEANDWNHVMEFLLGIQQDGARVMDSETARAAALRMTERAYKALSAGLHAEDVSRAWPKPRPRKPLPTTREP